MASWKPWVERPSGLIKKIDRGQGLKVRLAELLITSRA
jgi:hypothetical protein